MAATYTVYDYQDYVTNTAYGKDYTTVFVTIPVTKPRWSMEIGYYKYPVDGVKTVYTIPRVSGNEPVSCTIRYYPTGTLGVIDATNIPDGTLLSGSFNIGISNAENTVSEQLVDLEVACYVRLSYRDADGNNLDDNLYWIEGTSQSHESINGYFSFDDIEIDKPDGTAYIYINAVWDVFGCYDEVEITCEAGDLKLEFDVAALVYQQQQSGEANALLNQIHNDLAEQGQTLDDILEQQQNANDKLDDVLDQQHDTNEKLDELPGEIGNEIQDVIDSEQQEANDGGNDSVGQLQDAVPNYSDGFMDAISKFASSMSYEGTDAKLQIPAVTLPGIGGLFGSSTIYEGGELDFGSYVSFLPEGLLLLVQSLFTIALIVYCFIEFYSAISYVLTLKGGR